MKLLHVSNLVFVVLLVVAGVASVVNASSQTTTLNTTLILGTDAGYLGRVSVGTTTLDTTGAMLHVEGNQTTNGTDNVTALNLGAWNSRYTGTLAAAAPTSNHTWTLQDVNGTLALLDAAQSASGAWNVTGTWTFWTNPTFNANGISWASVSKAGSSLADLATRCACDLATGTLGRARADAATAYLDTAQGWTAVQSIPGADLKIVGSNDASKSLRFDLTGKSANYVAIINDTSTNDRAYFLPDHNGTFVLGNATETIPGAWTFTTNPTFNANGISWPSVSKSGSSLADLATRCACDLSIGSLAAARGGTGMDSSSSSGIPHVASGTWTVSSIASGDLPADVAYTDAANAWSTSVKQNFPSSQFRVVDPSDSNKRAQFDVTALQGDYKDTLNFSSSTDRAYFFPDHNATLVGGNSTESISGAWTFTTNPTFNANGISWPSVSKSGSSLADLATRCACDLSSGQLSDSRLSTNVPLLNAPSNAFAGDFAANTLTTTGKVVGSDAFFNNGAFNNTLSFGTGSGATLVDSGKIAASNVFGPTTIVNATLQVGDTSQAKDEALGVTPTGSIVGSASPYSVPGIRVNNATVTYTGATAESTNLFGTYFGVPTFTAANTPGTASVAATLYVENAPTCNNSGGATETCSSKFAVDVPNGAVSIGGFLVTGGSSQTNACRYCFAAVSSVVGSSSARDIVSGTSNTETFTGGAAQSGDLVNEHLSQTTYTAATTPGTTTNAATLKVDGAPVCNNSGGALQTCTNLYVAWFAGGLTRMDGNLQVATIAPSGDFNLLQNSVSPFTSKSSSAVANTLVMDSGNVIIGSPTSFVTGLSITGVPNAQGLGIAVAQSGAAKGPEMYFRGWTGSASIDSGISINSAGDFSFAPGNAGTKLGVTAAGATSVTGTFTVSGNVGFYGTSPVAQATRAGQMTDNTGGSATTTCAAITAGVTYLQTDATATKNCLASLQAQYNKLDTIIHNLGLTT